jgi:hypothetical protein
MDCSPQVPGQRVFSRSGVQPLILQGQRVELTRNGIAVPANLEQQLGKSIRWIHRAALLRWGRASLFTSLEHREFFVESGNQLSDSSFGEAFFPDWMFALQSLESGLQVSQV